MQLEPVRSRAIAATGYEAGEMRIVFHSGKIYSYPATEEEHAALRNAPSIGAWFSRYIRPKGGALVVHAHQSKRKKKP